MRMPLMIQLERDYPLSAPNVGFPVHFDYDMGATDHIQEGDLAGCMVLCLNITGNFKEYHSEWATQKGEGWSPSMTLSSLLVQLQSLLLDIRVDKRLLNRIQSYTCQVDEDNLHTHDNPFPAVSGGPGRRFGLARRDVRDVWHPRTVLRDGEHRKGRCARVRAEHCREVAHRDDPG